MQHISKYFAGQCNDEEKKEIEAWMHKSSENMKTFNEYKEIWEASTPPEYTPDVEKALRKVSDRLPEQVPAPKTFTFYALRVAAILVVGLGLFAIVKLPSKMETLTLLPTDAPLDVTLADGSHIWLNSGSTLRYPKKFRQKERRVEFEGEGYFKIAKNKAKPFVIESGHAITKVLGTEFNLSTHNADSLIRVTVTEGLVSFGLKKDMEKGKVHVSAGEVGEIDVQKGRVTQKVNTKPNYMAWKNGVLNFKNVTFGNAVKEIASFYHKNLVVADTSLNQERFYATFDSVPFAEALASIVLIMEVEIEKKPDTVYIHKKL